MNSPSNHEWEEGLDIDDSDLLLTPVIRPTNNTHIVPEITTTQTLFSSQNNQVDNCVVKPIRIIPGPAGIVQTAKLYKLVDTQEDGEESVMSTQEYIRKVIEDVGEDDDFTRVSWLSAIDYVNVDGGIMTGCFGDVKKFLKNGKLEQIVAVIKSCISNALGDLTVTLKDLSGTIHYKVLTRRGLQRCLP
ncbi:putative nucleotidyltransferase, ribonuclease H [Tanacetum coccineum]